MVDKEAKIRLQGKPLSSGLGAGKVYLYKDVLRGHDEFYEIDELQIDEELARLDRAMGRIEKDLGQLAQRVEQELDAELSGVFHAHIAMIQDQGLRAELETDIREELVSAGSSVRRVFRRWGRRFRKMESEVAQQKSDDMRDLARRLISSLAGIHGHVLENFPEGQVLVAKRLLPSDTIFLGRRHAAAVLLEVGGRGSHAALFAREIGLPCIAGLPGLLSSVEEGAKVLVDATAGQVVIHPSQEEVKAFDERRKERAEKQKASEAKAQDPAVTQDGVSIAVMANVASSVESKAAMASGADGIGLYRIEQAYLGRQQPPYASELLKEMTGVLEPARGKPVCVRLLDVGADKRLPFIDMARETNPSLGQRGIRFLQKYPDLLDTQLEALLKLSLDFDLHILVPMVVLPEDLLWVRARLTETAARLGIEPLPPLGAMIETPGAALAVKPIAAHADFLSFGTNDLTQYTFAVDRENAAVDTYFNDAHEAIFRLIKMVHDDVPKMPLSVCGELAGYEEWTGRILDCGVEVLSVAPHLVPAIKEAVRAHPIAGQTEN